jgi:hypothetical protein
MNTDRIDFISAYCDSWCERCAFTTRCSHYAVKVATEMCDGDFSAAIELAVGTPQPVDGEREETIGQKLLAELQNLTVSPNEIAEYERYAKARDARLSAHPITRMARTYTDRAIDWLKDHRERLEAGDDPVLREALEIVSWDAYLVGAKLHRALSGRDEAAHGELGDDHPIQNDWNGSAKVSLISLQRSASGWQTIFGATEDPAASILADGAEHLRRTVETDFPNAMSFVRPGFDDRPADC